MTVCIAEMPSYTYAVKGRKILHARGFPCEIKRNESASADSCGYSLYVYSNCRAAVKLLESYSIPYTHIVYGGA